MGGIYLQPPWPGKKYNQFSIHWLKKSEIHRLRKCQSFGFRLISYIKFCTFVISIYHLSNNPSDNTSIVGSFLTVSEPYQLFARVGWKTYHCSSCVYKGNQNITSFCHGFKPNTITKVVGSKILVSCKYSIVFGVVFGSCYRVTWSIRFLITVCVMRAMSSPLTTLMSTAILLLLNTIPAPRGQVIGF